MKTLVIAIVAMVTSTAAQADGFKCTGLNTGTVLKVYNNLSQNTRTAAIMIVSDPSADAGDRTIATFKSELMGYQGYGVFTAKVDLRYSGSNNSSREIAGTTLGELAKIKLSVDFDYAHADEAQAQMDIYDSIDGNITYVKRDGDQIKEAARCARYLKN